jgi:hypothetical protein
MGTAAGRPEPQHTGPGQAMNDDEPTEAEYSQLDDSALITLR